MQGEAASIGYGTKKGPLAIASGPSLGRKRPRRATVTPGATALQQNGRPVGKFKSYPSLGMLICKAEARIFGPLTHPQRTIAFLFRNLHLTASHNRHGPE